LRAFCDQIERPEGRRGMTLVMHPPRSFLERNHDIVDASEVLVAIPKETEEVLRSGTWATIRYAHKLRRRVMIIYPNGFTRSES
jgi:predicted Rossmann fold nucleotide-binding protein DprA/Smf involved in DNA uptake